MCGASLRILSSSPRVFVLRASHGRARASPAMAALPLRVTFVTGARHAAHTPAP